MSGEKIVLLTNTLGARKQLLLMESEMNRVELRREMARFDGEVERIVNEGKFLFSAASTIITGFKLVRRFWSGHRAGATGPPPASPLAWFSTFKELFSLGTNFWLKTRPNTPEQ